MGVAELVAGRPGHHHLARHMPRGGAGLAASRTSRALRSLTAHTAGLAWRPSTAGACGLVATRAFGGLCVLLGQSGPGLVLALGVVPNIRRPSGERDLQMWGCVQGTNSERGSAHEAMQEQREQIGRNSCEIRTKFNEFRISRIFTQIYSREIRAKFIPNSYEFRTSFM